MNRIKLTLYYFVFSCRKAVLLATSKPGRITLRIIVSINVYLTTYRYEILSFLFPKMSTAVLVVTGVKLLHQSADG